MRFLLAVLVIVLIVGAVAYGAQMMGIQIPYVSQFFANMSPGGGHAGHQMPGMQGGNQMPSSPFNQLATQNKDRLVQATTILNQAMELITNDPYSQITQSSPPSTGAVSNNNAGAITIPPRDGVTININPGQRRDFPPNTGNIVYDQTKLEQLHTGIFKYSQALMLLNELNNDLTDQSVMPEANPPTGDTYVIRYNLTQQNRAKLVQAGRFLQESIAMANVNPYAPTDGYVYNTQKMQQLHQGIYELGRSALMLSRLSEDLNQQMIQISNEARMARVQMSGSMIGMNNMAGMSSTAGMNMANMQHGSMSGDSMWIFNLAIIIIAFGIVLGVLILIKRLINEVRASQ
ncbi:hypothetical protein [Sporomusa acidovorans]|uniref:hypothetical protein n=1 Tax=Sporomusa acidovorans TaxID=112900 RepID=UPI00087FF9F9|nr:hypothetical protein [Sporomusa acidovorans]OZC18983.1 hypothetical protein SPACI_30690 [Sporomusa acidovorans DSM 3132]SDD72008.1 hypothetical protein SAMN04488499_1003157 [Sporomusa acidovorans]